MILAVMETFHAALWPCLRSDRLEIVRSLAPWQRSSAAGAAWPSPRSLVPRPTASDAPALVQARGVRAGFQTSGGDNPTPIGPVDVVLLHLFACFVGVLVLYGRILLQAISSTSF